MLCYSYQCNSLIIKGKYFGLIKAEKDASRTKVIEIFPYISSELSRKKDSNKADAILIASYFYVILTKSLVINIYLSQIDDTF